MKEISIGKGMKALVDDEDFERLHKFKWHTQIDHNIIYAVRVIRENGKRHTVRMHRDVLNLRSKDRTVVDHINRNGCDNQKKNLRIVTLSENAINSKITIRNTSGYRGVCWSKRSNKWRAAITVNGKQIHIGVFNEKIEAAKAYDDAARKYHNEFAVTNFQT